MSLAVVAAADQHRLEAGRLQVLEDQVLVVVLAVDLQLDLDQVAALELGQVRQLARARTSRPSGRAAWPRQPATLIFLSTGVSL